MGASRGKPMPSPRSLARNGAGMGFPGLDPSVIIGSASLPWRVWPHRGIRGCLGVGLYVQALLFAGLAPQIAVLVVSPDDS